MSVQRIAALTLSTAVLLGVFGFAGNTASANGNCATTPPPAGCFAPTNPAPPPVAKPSTPSRGSGTSPQTDIPQQFVSAKAQQEQARQQTAAREQLKAQNRPATPRTPPATTTSVSSKGTPVKTTVPTRGSKGTPVQQTTPKNPGSTASSVPPPRPAPIKPTGCSPLSIIC